MAERRTYYLSYQFNGRLGIGRGVGIWVIVNAGHGEGTLLVVGEILRDFVFAWTASNGNRNNRTGVFLFEEGNQRFHQQRLETGGGMGDVGLHGKVAGQIDGAGMEVEGAAEIHCDAGRLEGDSLRGEDTIAYFDWAAERR